MKKIDNFNFVGNATTKNLNLNFTLMYTDLQIDCIRAFGDKELKFGCLFKYHEEWDNDILMFSSIYDDTGNTKTLSFLCEDKESTWEINEFSDDIEIEILGSEPQWHDVFAKFSGDFIGLYKNQIDIGLPGIQKTIPCDASRPLLEQPQAMEQLLSLIKGVGQKSKWVDL